MQTRHLRFDFSTATQVVFGAGTLGQVPGLVAPLGRRVVLIHGAQGTRAQPLLSRLGEAGLETRAFSIAHEPKVDDVEALALAARSFGAEAVIGFGGGSVLDTAKAVAVLLNNKAPIRDYLEVVGKGQPFEAPAAPMLAIPTTSGTGAEVTRNAVLGVPEHGVKVSMRGPQLMPRIAVVDPELTLSLPAKITAATGMDALCQLIEAYVCLRANPMTDALCQGGIPRAAHSLPLACENPEDLTARSDLALAALWSGMALANAGLGAVHGLAGPLGGLCPSASHGALCGALLGPITRVNVQALRQRLPDSPALGRYAEVARWLTRRIDACAEDAATWLEHFSVTLGIPRLPALGVLPSHYPEAISRGLKASSMRGNPISLEPAELETALRSAS